MSLDFAENKGNRIEVESNQGEAIITVYSKEMGCELIVCLTEDDTAKFKSMVKAL